MVKTNRFKLFAVVAAALALCLLSLVGTRPAEAAFPGGNGKIAFQSNRDGTNIFTISPTGGTASKITSADAAFPKSGNGDPAFSPDGNRIAFISPSRTNYEVSVMNADGTGWKPITATSVAEQDPAFSPDGTKIAYASSSRDVDGQTDLEIWKINANGTGRTQLTSNDSLSDTQPAFSPDGSKIAFVHQGDIWVMNPDGSGQTNLTPDSPAPCSSNCYQGGDEYPAFSPDGTKIAYVHGYGPPTNPYAGGGLPNIWVMDTDPATNDWTNLSNTGSESSTMPAWSPDGAKIAYVGTASGSTDRNIYVMDASGSISSRTPIDTNTAFDVKPDWQPITLSINDVKVKEKNTNAIFTVRLSSNSEQTVTVNYATADGSAKAPADYTAQSGTLTFNPGQTAQQIRVPIRSDRRNERNEKFFVNLSDATDPITVFDAQGRATIVDND